MPNRKKYLLALGQIWTIGKKTHDNVENGFNRWYISTNKPLISLGYECEILKVSGVHIDVKDISSGLAYSVKTQNLGKRIK
ncbi:hypothetical protein [Paenibacillus polymyxa]|uniref:hypothetical protein n=1 Tax=Paenibacillus polymyxa TaxID=1406 RepID=UPI000845D30C|nr:hypothetical protein [Paenibacillus polymyxa]AOK91775.1 hypothetical protein AOU00_19345 [Paenibacillus polymyxa]